MKLNLPSNEVHLWFIDLNRAIAHSSQFGLILSVDEQERARRYHNEHHRQSFVTARSILRILVSRYLAIPPDEVLFSYENYGKPILSPSFASSLQFNSSRSGTFALFAFMQNCSVGVDLEVVRSMPNLNQLAQRFFTERESGTLQALPVLDQQHCFFRYWTCKEAYLKATGVGLTALENVEIELDPYQPGESSKIANADQNSNQWQLHELQFPNNCIGAIAWNGAESVMKYQDFV